MTSNAEQFWLALIAVVLALMLVTWAYGIYCYIQMVRHRRPGVPVLSMLWPPESLSPRGSEFRRRALRTYAAFGILALLLVVLTQLLPH